MMILTLTIVRAIRVQARNVSDWLMPAVFFILSASLMSYLLNLPAPKNIQMSYILLVLAMLLPLNGFYQQDRDNGFFEILHNARISLLTYCYGRILALVLLQMIGLLPAILLYGVIANISLALMPIYLFCGVMLIIGCGFIGAMMAAFFGDNHGGRGGFIALLVLPLILPWLIFASSSVSHLYYGLAIEAHILWLLAYSPCWRLCYALLSVQKFCIFPMRDGRVIP